MEGTLLIIEAVEAIAIIGLFVFMYMIHKEIGPTTKGELPE